MQSQFTVHFRVPLLSEQGSNMNYPPGIIVQGFSDRDSLALALLPESPASALLPENLTTFTLGKKDGTLSICVRPMTMLHGLKGQVGFAALNKIKPGFKFSPIVSTGDNRPILFRDEQQLSDQILSTLQRLLATDPEREALATHCRSRDFVRASASYEGFLRRALSEVLEQRDGEWEVTEVKDAPLPTRMDAFFPCHPSSSSSQANQSVFEGNDPAGRSTIDLDSA